MQSLKIKSYAKINITLLIGNKRKDGYHNIKSIMQSISLYDTITLTKTKEKKITCNLNVSTIPTDKNNLAVKAADIFLKFLNIPYGLNIYIDKKIPTKAGLGGASSNAAFVLIGLNKLYKTNISYECLLKLASKIGSDVPFFIKGGTALVEGRGEKIKNITPIKNCNILIVKPNFDVSTKDAYLKYDEKITKSNKIKKDNTEIIYKYITKKEKTKKYCKYMFNNFEEFFETKYIIKIKKKLLSLKAKKCMLCGSGSSIFAIFTKTKEAKTAAEYFKKNNISTYICNPIKKYF